MIWSRLKIAASLALLASLALPFSSCTHSFDADGKEVLLKSGETLPEGGRQELEYGYVLAEFEPQDPIQYLFLLGFLWPLATSLYQIRSRRGKLAAALWWLEPPLLAFTAWLFAGMLIFNEPASGFVVAVAALGLYAAAWTAQAINRWRSRGNSGRDPDATSLDPGRVDT